VADEFQRLVGALDYPMYVVTAAAGDERDGALVGFGTQVSIHPAEYLVALSDKNRTTRIAAAAETLAVHLVPEGRKDLAELFGGTTKDEGVDKLERVDWSAGPGGAPVIAELPTHFVGRIKQRLDWDGDHIGFVLVPLEAAFGDDAPWLSFQRVKDLEPGHEA
jgi:flavin reductase (DIM6/NTAB) family NADH-FMN oxidoreductase RutF